MIILDALIWENVFALRKILFENPTDAQMRGRVGLANADESRKGRGPPRERAAFESVFWKLREFAETRNPREREASRGTLGRPHDMRRKDLS